MILKARAAYKMQEAYVMWNKSSNAIVYEVIWYLQRQSYHHDSLDDGSEPNKKLLPLQHSKVSIPSEAPLFYLEKFIFYLHSTKSVRLTFTKYIKVETIWEGYP